MEIKYWVLATAAIYILFTLFRRKKTYTCPNCGHAQSDFCILDETTRTQMSNGRITKSGSLDKRYNTQFHDIKLITYGVDCDKCDTTYSYLNGKIEIVDPKEFYEKSNKNIWLYFLYKQSVELGNHFRKLEKDRDELLRNINEDLMRKYKFKNKDEVLTVFRLIDTIESNSNETQSEWLKKLNAEDSDLAENWTEYDEALTRSMVNQKRNLEKLGIDASHIDKIINKYGLKTEKFEEIAESKELMDLLSNIFYQSEN